MSVEVSTYWTHVLHERETGLFLALFAAERELVDGCSALTLKRYHQNALDEFNKARVTCIEQLNGTFQAGDIVRITATDGTHEDRVYQYAARSHIYVKWPPGNKWSGVSGFCLVDTAKVTLIHRAHSGRTFEEDGA